MASASLTINICYFALFKASPQRRSAMCHILKPTKNASEKRLSRSLSVAVCDESVTFDRFMLQPTLQQYASERNDSTSCCLLQSCQPAKSQSDNVVASTNHHKRIWCWIWKPSNTEITLYQQSTLGQLISKETAWIWSFSVSVLQLIKTEFRTLYPVGSASHHTAAFLLSDSKQKWPSRNTESRWAGLNCALVSYDKNIE